MKVAYVTTRFPGLAETFTCLDIRELCVSGVDVSVYTMRSPRTDAARLLKERHLSGLFVSQGTVTAHLAGFVRCVTCPGLFLRLVGWLARHTWRRPAHLLTGLALVPRSIGILESLERERPDVVHLFWGHYPSMVGYLVLTAMPDVTVSLFLGAYDLLHGFGGTGWVAQRAHLVSTHARCNFQRIEALGVRAEHIHLAYRGIDPNVFAGKTAEKVKGRIVCAGRLDVGKGTDEVLRVFQRVLVRQPAASLKVLGSGPERARLEQLARALAIDRAVTFGGHVPQSRVAEELLAAEVFLFMSWEDSERLPNVVKEAMAARCICVVTKTPGIDELLEHERHGYQVNRGEVSLAASRIDDVLSGRVDVAAMRNAAADQIASRFDVAKSMQSYRLSWQKARSARTQMRPHATAAPRSSAAISAD